MVKFCFAPSVVIFIYIYHIVTYFSSTLHHTPGSEAMRLANPDERRDAGASRKVVTTRTSVSCAARHPATRRDWKLSRAPSPDTKPASRRTSERPVTDMFTMPILCEVRNRSCRIQTPKPKTSGSCVLLSPDREPSLPGKVCIAPASSHTSALTQAHRNLVMLGTGRFLRWLGLMA